MPQFKIPQKVKHVYFGVGQTVMYDSGSRMYTVEFGQNPVIRRRCEECDLSECQIQTDTQTRLEAWV
ncbi:hypothetical protein [Methanococcoides sp. FTZ1]|uniref:hypothetical protein n=1 Tax=Methanococcoides sp. FTZ1 TaxID=3439061 RepID=UPI003F8508FE